MIFSFLSFFLSFIYLFIFYSVIEIKGYNSTPINIYEYLISFILFLLTYIGRFVFTWLTRFEKHKVRMNHSLSKMAKFVINQLLLVIVTYTVQRHTEVKQDLCQTPEYANKVFYFMLSKIKSNNFFH